MYPDPKTKATNPAYRSTVSTEFDLVAVHGLGYPNMDGETNARVTWGTSPHDYMWIHNELPKVYPNSRIFLYAYDAIATYGKNKDTFINKASELLETVQVEIGGR